MDRQPNLIFDRIDQKDIVWPKIIIFAILTAGFYYLYTFIVDNTPNVLSALGLNGRSVTYLTTGIAIALFIGLAIIGTSLMVNIWRTQASGLKKFALDNAFEFVVKRINTPALILFDLKRCSVYSTFKMSGRYSGYNFEIYMVHQSSRSYPRGEDYLGLVCVGLGREIGDVIADPLDMGWDKKNITPVGLIAGWQTYSLQGSLGTPARWGEFLETVKSIGTFDIETRGKNIYFIEKDGFAFTKEGVQKLFDLIKAVEVLD